ncbi:MAG: hypothetical protein V3R52_07505 [Candidatus Neomarinimicrobiota bacterium]
MAYPDSKENFTPVTSPEFIQILDINELQTLLETLQDVIGIFPNWFSGTPADIGNIFVGNKAIKINLIQSFDVNGLRIGDDTDTLGVHVADGGKVGIMKTGATVALDVNGSIRVSDGVFVDRGNATGWDFADFTTNDGTAYDLDLGSIVPTGAKTVCLKVVIIGDTVGEGIYFRSNDRSNNNNATRMANTVANVNYYADIVVACDSSQIIEYTVTNGSDLACWVTVKGWWN